jgi:hypothetical protein
MLNTPGASSANGEVAAITILLNSAAAEPLPQRRRTLSNVLFMETTSGGFGWLPSNLVKSGSSQTVSVALPVDEYTLLIANV